MISIPASPSPDRRGSASALARVAAALMAAAGLGLIAASGVRAETIGGNPGPAHNYVCPHADGKPALDCYFDAVLHLYTMCRDVKAIENIEFGYEKSTEGTNGAKTEYCLDKQKENIKKPFLAALKQARISRQAESALKDLQQVWVSALANLQWRFGESDTAYKSRVLQPYEEFKDRIVGIRTIYTVVSTHTEKPARSHNLRHEVRHTTQYAPEVRRSTSQNGAKAN